MISDRLLKCCVENIEQLIEEAWILTAEYVEMEKATSLLPELEKDPIKTKYN